MNKLIGVLGVMVILAGTGLAGADGSPVVKKQGTCPVMGGAVNTNLFVDFEGKRIYVCCKGCLPEVKKDPAKYISKLEKDGVKLDKVEPKAK